MIGAETSHGGSTLERVHAPIWVLAAIGLTLLDAFATTAGVDGGFLREGNPIWALVIDRLGVADAMAMRALIGVGLVGLLWLLALGHRLARRGLQVVVVALGGVAVLHATFFALAL